MTDWRDRFKAPAVTSAQVARDNPDRGVVITDIHDKFQAYAWDRLEGSVKPVTDTKAAVTTTAISHDGSWIYALVETDAGSEIGHIHRFSFDARTSEDVTPELAYYTSFGFRPTSNGLVAAAGLEGKQTIVVVRDGQSHVIQMPSLVIGIEVHPDEDRAAVTMSTPGRGMVPMMRIVDLDSGEVLGEGSEMAAGGIHDGMVAVSYVDGDWTRPGVWQDGALRAIDLDLPGNVRPVDWSSDGSSILLTQSYRAKTALFLYEVSSEAVTPLPSPAGSTYPASDPALIGPDRAISLWSDANNPWRAFEATPDGYELALRLEEQRSFPGPQWEEFGFPSNGGVEIQGWLLRPPGDGPWPTVLYTHGGPTSVAGPMFSPLGSAWFDAGFAVASINYRGSTTFGESFREALTGNLGGPDVEDVVAARHWLVEQGIARPDAIVKNGYSYGGYLTLQSLGTHPDLWAAGVAGAPIADWRMAYEDSNDVLKGYFVSIWGGTPDQIGEAMVESSPTSHVDAYSAPLLITQPEGDSRTPLRPVQSFVDDLVERGKEVELVIMAGGHAGSGIGQTIGMVEAWLEFADRVVDVDS